MKQTTPTKTKMPKLNGLQTLNAKYNDYGYEFIKISHGDARIMFDGEVVLATRARNYIQEMTDAMKSCPWLFYSMYNSQACQYVAPVQAVEEEIKYESCELANRPIFSSLLTCELPEPLYYDCCHLKDKPLAVEVLPTIDEPQELLANIWTRLGHFNTVAFWMLTGEVRQSVSAQPNLTSSTNVDTLAAEGAILDKEATKEFQSGLALQP